MNFSDLKGELAERGFSYLADTRLGRYINWARAELDDTDLWPYREASVTGVAPFTVVNLGTIEQVSNLATGQAIPPVPYDDLQTTYGDLSIGGTPQAYYVGWPDGTPEVATYPTSGDTIGVQYWRVTTDLVEATDEPAAPVRFHKIILDMAARECYRDSDNHEAAEQLQVQIDRDVWRMRESLLTGTTQGPQDYVRVTEGW